MTIDGKIQPEFKVSVDVCMIQVGSSWVQMLKKRKVWLWMWVMGDNCRNCFWGKEYSSCGSRACPQGMWNLPGPGVKPMSLALIGDFLTTEPLEKSPVLLLKSNLSDTCFATSFGFHAFSFNLYVSLGLKWVSWR